MSSAGASTSSAATDGNTNENSNPSDGSKTLAHEYGCSHYARRCALVAPCCGKVYTCRVCHDDAESHRMDRFAVAEILCLACNTKQAVGRNCVSCGVEFGKYFCEICRLYDDTDKRQFHCDGCGICRLHGRQNYFHCPTCDTCLHVDMKRKHNCVEKVSQGKCAVCLEDLHTSTESLRVLDCGHLLHRKCFKGLLRSRIFNCPCCCRSMIDRQATWRRIDAEVAQTPMPLNLRTRLDRIRCRDCHQVSTIPFHVVGMRCQSCGSYNTCIEASPVMIFR